MTKKKHMQFLKKYHHSFIDYDTNELWENRITINEMMEISKIAAEFGLIKHTKNKNFAKNEFLKDGFFHVDSHSSIELYLIIRGYGWKFLYVAEPAETDNDEVKKITGLTALLEFKNECGDLLKPFAMRDTEEIMAVKRTIEKYNISMTPMGELYYINKEIKNVAHIDINSAFPAGLVDTYPQFKDFFLKHYNLRKKDPKSKAIMNYAIGASQTVKFPWLDKYPELARAAIAWTNRRLNELTQALTDNGYIVIAYNTDGLFYQKPEYIKEWYHDKDEGTDLGQWKQDHTFDKIRFKSAGSYEYVENGKYHPVVRGQTTLERPKSEGGKGKPRSEWVWGDIFQAQEYKYQFIDNVLTEVLYG